MSAQRTRTLRERRRLRTRIIGGAIILIIIMAFVLFTPSRLVRYVAAAYLAAVALSYIYSRIAVAFLSAYKETSVVRGHKLERIPVSLFVENRGLLPLAYVTVRDVIGRLSSRTMGQFLISMPAATEEKLTYEVVGQKIGEYFTGPIELSGYDPLGFFPWRKRFDEKTRIVIYPNVYPVETVNTKGLPTGNIRVANKIYEDVTQFRSIREYVAGDEMKRINWKVTARMGKLYSMEFQPTLYFPVLIFLNLSQDDYPMRHREHLVERASEVAASLIFYFVDLKQEVGLITTGRLEGKEEPPVAEVKAGYGHALNLMEIISCAKLSEGSADFQRALFESGIKIPMGTRVMVISPRLKEEQLNVLLGATRKSMSIEYFQIILSGSSADEEMLIGGVKTYPVLDYGEKLING